MGLMHHILLVPPHTAKYDGNLPPLKELLLAGGPQTEFIFGNEKFLNVNSMVLVY